MTTSFESIKKLKKEYMDKIQAEAQPIMKEHLLSILDRIPEIVGFRWTQYTPHFNDGEPCRFGVNEIYVGLNRPVPLTQEQADEEEQDDGAETCQKVAWDTPWGHKYDGRITEETAKIWEEAIGEFDEDLCEHAFGDGVRVWARRAPTPEGLEFEVEEYRHD